MASSKVLVFVTATFNCLVSFKSFSVRPAHFESAELDSFEAEEPSEAEEELWAEEEELSEVEEELCEEEVGLLP